MRGIGVVVGEVAVDVTEQLGRFAAQATEQVANESAGHAVAGIEGDFHRAGELDVAEDAVEVLLAHVDLLVRAGTAGKAAGFDTLAQGLDLFAVDRLAGEDHLEAVVVGGVVAAGDHDAGGGTDAVEFDVGAEVDHGGGDHAQVEHVQAGSTQAFYEAGDQVRPRKPPVAADHDRLLAQLHGRRAERQSDLACDLAGERFAHDAADVIGFEDRGIDLHVASCQSCRARRTPQGHAGDTG
ncbi:hypothetical protein D3C81_1010130 [compost metagenome]